MKTERKSLLSTEGRRILSLLEDRTIADDEIAKEKNGRPFFIDRRADFNVSHSGNMAAVSLVKGGKGRTGCDIQLVQSRANTMRIAEQFFSAAEQEYTMDSETRFFHIWTLKECFIKLKGLSVFDMADVPSFICSQSGTSSLAFSTPVTAPLLFYLYELTGPDEHYMLATAIEGCTASRPEIRWFSQSFLTERSIAEIKAALSPPETVSPKT